VRDLKAGGRRSFVRLLEVDPEFAVDLDEQESGLASKYLLARSATLPGGQWDPAREPPRQSARALGVLMMRTYRGRIA
jgi:hypothetical protein